MAILDIADAYAANAVFCFFKLQCHIYCDSRFLSYWTFLTLMPFMLSSSRSSFVSFWASRFARDFTIVLHQC